MSNLAYQNFEVDTIDDVSSHHSTIVEGHEIDQDNGSDVGDSDLQYLIDDLNEEGTGIISEESLPAHACSYCGIHSPDSVLKCNTCNKWFCNSKSHGGSSHIVTHMVLSRHNSVSLHEESELGDTNLECYNCGNKNVFILGFVSAKRESVVIILCRLPCAQNKDFNWDVNSWQSLIEERQFLPWIASIPQEEELINSKLVSHDQITKLETQWRLNRDATIEDVDNDKTEEEEVLPILMRYNDAFQYQHAFAPLVQLEASYDKSLKESQALEHISIKWAMGLNFHHLASFSLSTFESTDLKIAVGDEIILRYNRNDYEKWEGHGYIIRLPNSHQEEFTLELSSNKIKPPIHLNTGFTAEFVWKGTSYERMQLALKRFAIDQESVSGYIYHKLLGHDVNPIEFDINLPEKLSHPNLTKLNSSQTNAVKSVLKRPLSLIQGPPGTGKTVTSATIIYHLSKLNKKKTLVCAPSNVAVDHLAAKLDSLGLSVVRLTAKSREDVESSVDHLSLHNLVNKSAKGELKNLIKLRDEIGELADEDSKSLFKLVKNRERKILNKCDVVCCTCVGAGDRRLSELAFRTVLIDESTQASEPEVLIPIVQGAKQVILVGDHQQLGPVILDKKAGDAGLKQSLFERLVVLGHVPIRLEVQYRMHPILSEFPSNMFYEGSLQNGVNLEQRLINNSTFPWPVYNNPMMFWANYGKEEMSSSGVSFLNRVEAMNVEKIVTRLFKDGIKPNQIGVITPYEGQRAYINQYMSINSTLIDRRNEYLEIEVTSVDAFQGREKDFIILSCVRANDGQNIGFLKDPRRLNVALTRAKYGLVILGNPRALSRNKLWNHLLIHFRERGCLVDGPLENLQLSMVTLNTKTRGNLPGEKQMYKSKFGLNSTNFSGSSTNFDTESVLSYADSRISNTGNWPTLEEAQSQQVFNSEVNLNANFASRLNDINQHYDKNTNHQMEDDIKSITSSFAAGLNLN